MAVIVVLAAFGISKFVNDKRKRQKALSEVKTLSGLIPICASCKKIRDNKGYWSSMFCAIRFLAKIIGSIV